MLIQKKQSADYIAVAIKIKMIIQFKLIRSFSNFNDRVLNSTMILTESIDDIIHMVITNSGVVIKRKF